MPCTRRQPVASGTISSSIAIGHHAAPPGRGSRTALLTRIATIESG